MTSLSSTVSEILSLYMTACDLEESFIFDNKSSPESFGKSRTATPHSRKWTRPLRVLAVQCPQQMSPMNQPPVRYNSAQTDT